MSISSADVVKVLSSPQDHDILALFDVVAFELRRSESVDVGERIAKLV